MSRIKVFTDGSCYYKTRMGGAGVLVGDIELSKGYSNTTVNRMEMRALLMALEYVDKGARVDVYSDSQYVVKAFTENRLTRYIQRGFHEVKNADLWVKIHSTIKAKKIDMKITHIDGHQEVVCELTAGNAIADLLADYKSHESYEKDLDD